MEKISVLIGALTISRCLLVACLKHTPTHGKRRCKCSLAWGFCDGDKEKPGQVGQMKITFDLFSGSVFLTNISSAESENKLDPPSSLGDVSAACTAKVPARNPSNQARKKRTRKKYCSGQGSLENGVRVKELVRLRAGGAAGATRPGQRCSGRGQPCATAHRRLAVRCLFCALYSLSARFVVVYPVYINAEVSLADGRKVRKDQGVANPTSQEFYEASKMLAMLGYAVVFEVTLVSLISPSLHLTQSIPHRQTGQEAAPKGLFHLRATEGAAKEGRCSRWPTKEPYARPISLLRPH